MGTEIMYHRDIWTEGLHTTTGGNAMMQRYVMLASVIFSLFLCFAPNAFALEIHLTELAPTSVPSDKNSEGAAFWFQLGDILENPAEIVLAVQITNAENMYRGGFDLVFDPNILAFVEAEPGEFLGNADFHARESLASDKQYPGQRLITVGYKQIRKKSVMNGSGTIALLRFRILQNGDTALRLVRRGIYTPQIDPHTERPTYVPSKAINVLLKVE